MKILHVVDHSIPLHSGYTFRSRAIFLAQRAAGLETCHLTSPKHAAAASHNPPEEEVEGLRFFRTQPAGGLRKLPVLDQWGVVSALKRRLDEVVRKTKPDIIHAHSPALNGIAAVQAGRRHRIPVVYEVRGFWEDAAVSHGTAKEGSLRYRLTRGMESWVLRRADAATCICEGIRGDLMERGIPGERITIIPNSVDAERFQPIVERDAALGDTLGLKNGDKVIGFIGSFYGYEGLSLLLEALPEMLESLPALKVLLVGGGQERERLESLADRLNVRSHVIFTGRVPHDEVERYYSLVDILVYPRLSMRLTELVTPLKPLEAMAQQRLFVASDVGGHRELVRYNADDLLFRAGDTGDLAQKVVRLMEHKEIWSRLREEGRRYALEERTWGNSVGRYLPLYERLKRN